MATLKRVKRKRGEAYQIFFVHPKTGKKIRRIVWCSKKDAEKIVKKIEADIALGHFGIQTDIVLEYSWEQLKKKYLAYSKRSKSPKTTKREVLVFNAFGAFLDGNPLLKEIDTNVIERYKDYRLENGLKPATVSIELRILKTVFNMGIEWDMTEVNPTIKVKLPKADIIKIRFLIEEEIQQLLEVIEKDNNRPFQRMVLAYLHTGARRIELLAPNFTWNNVNFKDRKIVLVGLKGTSRRYIPMNNTLLALLKEIKKEGNDYPFQFKPDYVSHKITDYYKLAKIEGANLHSLRKTFGSMLLQSKATDLYTVSRLLGHATIKTTEKYYIDLLDENYRQPVYGLDDLF